MSKLFDPANCGSAERRRRLMIIVITVTAVLVAIVSVALVATLVTDGKRGNEDPDTDLPTDDDSAVSANTVKEYSFNDTKSGNLLIVNSTSAPYDFEVNTGSSLVSIVGNMPKADDNSPMYLLSSDALKADSTALSAFNSMITAFYKQSADAAKKITVHSAYRSYEDQKNYSTKQGHSDFHTGLLFELVINKDKNASIGSDASYKWIYENAHKYGFVMRYPTAKQAQTGISYEFDNALRYVGVAHATYMYQNNLCLEEYVELLKTKTPDAPLKIGSNYEVYYVKANEDQTKTTSVSVPSRYTYEVSGDNAGGFIVTVKKK